MRTVEPYDLGILLHEFGKWDFFQNLVFRVKSSSLLGHHFQTGGGRNPILGNVDEN